MWIFTKDFGSYNIDTFDKLTVNTGGTFLTQWGKPSCMISRSDVQEIIRDAIRRGDNFVEVE
jgi:hypothetical protein